MLDLHTHILPSFDDGSKNPEESVLLLQMLKQQGVDTLAATPHFYSDVESVEHFLVRRNSSLEALKRVAPSDAPRLLVGAEVRFYDGISRLEGLSSLCIEGTKLLLLEMPFCKWTDFTLKELTELSCSSEYTIVLAHIDRYLATQGIEVFARLRENGILMQMNCEFFNRVFTRSKAIKLLMEGFVSFIGSDCHNLNTRAPEMDKTISIIKRRVGNAIYKEFDSDCHNLLENYKL